MAESGRLEEVLGAGAGWARMLAAARGDVGRCCTTLPTLRMPLIG